MDSDCVVAREECRERCGGFERRIAAIEERVQVHGETIAALKAQVATAAAVGSLVGGGVVSAILRLLR